MNLRAKLTAAGLAAGVLGAVLTGTAPTASASPPGLASSRPECSVAAPGHPDKTVAIPCPAGHPGTAVATASAVGSLAAAPDVTPPNSQCTGLGSSFFGWFGAAPGSSADGGVANDLWWDATQSKSPAQMQVYTGNGGANQQWCEQYVGSGAFIFFGRYAGPGTIGQCLTVLNGHGVYSPGKRVYADTCDAPQFGSPQDQFWYVCPRSGNSVSLEPASATPSSVWLDVFGGTSNNGKSAFVPGNPLQIWTGNGQDNQRFTFFPSPGEPSLTYEITTGIPGC